MIEGFDEVFEAFRDFTSLDGENNEEKDTSERVKEITEEEEETESREIGTDFNYKFQQRHISRHIFFLTIHVCAMIGVYYCFTDAKYTTIVWAAILALLNNRAVVLAANGAYSHGSFKSTKSLKLALMFFQTMAGQNHIFWWARDQRVLHKYADTDADPYNASRGFYFAHFGWILVEKHPLVIEKSKQIDLSDLLADDWIMFQRKYFSELYFFVGFLLPLYVPYYFWNENLWISFCVAYCLRYVIVLHTIFTINSFGRKYRT